MIVWQQRSKSRFTMWHRNCSPKRVNFCRHPCLLGHSWLVLSLKKLQNNQDNEWKPPLCLHPRGLHKQCMRHKLTKLPWMRLTHLVGLQLSAVATGKWQQHGRGRTQPSPTECTRGKMRHSECRYPAGDMPRNERIRKCQKKTKRAETESLENTFTHFWVVSFFFFF